MEASQRLLQRLLLRRKLPRCRVALPAHEPAPPARPTVLVAVVRAEGGRIDLRHRNQRTRRRKFIELQDGWRGPNTELLRRHELRLLANL